MRTRISPFGAIVLALGLGTATFVAVGLLQPPSVIPADSAWGLIDGTVDGQRIVPIEGWPTTLVVDARGLRGNLVCNGYSMSAVVVRGTIRRLDGPAMTLRRCDVDPNDFEDIYARALMRVDSWTLEGDRLTLRGDGVELRYFGGRGVLFN